MTKLERNFSDVAQIFNLLYRRFAIGWAPKLPGPTYFPRQQNTILRYSRLKICATTSRPDRKF